MGAQASGSLEMRRPRQPERLKQLADESREIHRAHKKGEISAQEAARRLAELRMRYSTLFDRILAL